MTIADADAHRGSITLIIQRLGVTSHKITQLNPGDCLADVSGPLGRPTRVETVGTVLACGGGVGIAPILFMARKANPGQMTVVIGGRNKEEVFWKDLFPKTLKELIVTTDDGSYGIKGFSVSVLPELFKNGNVDEACVCGPGIMMRITAQMAKEANVPCEVSMERRMGCGIGTCLGCVCDRADGKGHYKVCVDGPVFKAEEVVL